MLFVEKSAFLSGRVEMEREIFLAHGFTLLIAFFGVGRD